MIDASKMTFEEWKKAKREEEQKITRGAEVVPYKTDSGLYQLEGAILQVCFHDKLFFHNLYFIPPDLDHGQRGIYGYKRIMISKPYYQAHGLDDDIINTMFHECVHAWDAIKGKQDTDGKFSGTQYHNEQFKETCELFGGCADYRDAAAGYADARLTDATMQKVKRKLKQWTA